MVFSKKWLRNQENFLLHFLIHIDVLTCMLCSKFELIPTSIFEVTAILRNRPIFRKYPRLSPWFFQKLSPKSRKKFITFSDTY